MIKLFIRFIRFIIKNEGEGVLKSLFPNNQLKLPFVDFFIIRIYGLSTHSYTLLKKKKKNVKKCLQ